MACLLQLKRFMLDKWVALDFLMQIIISNWGHYYFLDFYSSFFWVVWSGRWGDGRSWWWRRVPVWILWYWLNNHHFYCRFQLCPHHFLHPSTQAQSKCLKFSIFYCFFWWRRIIPYSNFWSPERGSAPVKKEN